MVASKVNNYHYVRASDKYSYVVIISKCVVLQLCAFDASQPPYFSFYASLPPAIIGVMCLALCQKEVSQAPQHFRSSETQATCDGCIAYLLDQFRFLL